MNNNEWNLIFSWIAGKNVSKSVKNYIFDSKKLSQENAVKEFELIKDVSLLEALQIRTSNFGIDRVVNIVETILDNEPLEALDYRVLADFLGLHRQLFNDVQKQNHLENFKDFLSFLEPDISLEMTLKQTVSSKGEISSQASEELASIRKNLQRTHKRIGDKIKEMIKSPSLLGMLQESYFTIRDDRYVLPFKSNYKRVIKGVIHNYSRTGLTAFLEPLALVELNNELFLLSKRENEEILKILKQLRGLVVRKMDYIQETIQKMLHIETLSIKQKWAKEFDCVIPEFENRKISIKEAWYPPVFIAEHKNVVKNDFLFKENEKIMVISGPNAGGKTVALKTLSTISKLAVRGFPVPAKKAIIPFFDNIFEILGDNQSAVEGESSFSAHLNGLSEILKQADTHSLVLVDEIGTGTDPIQGGAISRAFLEFLKEKNVFTLVTSHLAEVKSIALEDSSFIPVAMGFDENRGPNYKFLYNLVGSSNAMALVRKINFPKSFVKRVENLLVSKDESVEPLLNRLKQKEQELKTRKEEIEKLNSEILKEKEKIENLRKSLEKKERDFEINRLKTLDKLMTMEERELKKRIEQTTEKKLAKRVALIKKEKESLKDAIKKEKMKKDETPGIPFEEYSGKIEPNKTVVYDKWLKMKGIFKSQKGKKVEISINGKNFSTKSENLLVVEEKIKKKTVSKIAVSTTSVVENVDVRGMNSLEAMEKIEKMIDTAFLNGTFSITIVHGHGSGILKKTIREKLVELSSKYKFTFSSGSSEQKSDGTTVVTFENE